MLCYHLFFSAQQEGNAKKLSLLMTEVSHREDRIKILEAMCTEPNVETEVEIMKELSKGLPVQVYRVIAWVCLSNCIRMCV